MAFYPTLGMKPVLIRKEIEAFVADRLLESLWREALWLIHDGICTTEELDDIVRYGFGLRWAQMGVFDTYRVAGGEAGMRHFMAQFGPCLAWPWSHLTDVPPFDDALVDLIAGQSDAQSRPHPDPRARAHPRRQPRRHPAGAEGPATGAPASSSPNTSSACSTPAPRSRRRTSSQPIPTTARTRPARLDRLQRPHERGPLPAGASPTPPTPSCG